MLTIDALKSFGANVDEGLTRCMKNEGFYFRLVKMAVQDAGYDKLQTALNEGNLDAAFEAAHGLKGILANLALTPILTPVSEMTELLRARTQTDYQPLLAQMMAKRDELAAICAE